ncbi:hypothetical protein MMC07_008717 [Pseudocyphellaria aurata]|nr:hypothetical protein [Pseudocyphellaria aurata]
MAPSEPPFRKEHEINYDLTIVGTQDGSGGATVVNADNEGRPTLPGHPQVVISNSLQEFLSQELLTPELDLLSPHLWLVATQRSSHVSALHHQLVRGRSITITEDPKLHLLWIDNRIYIKPIPAYLLNHAFWVIILSQESTPFLCDIRGLLSSSALGFLRSYTYLIQHESDFHLAKTFSLIPSSLTWIAWNRFSSSLHDVPDADVNQRYLFGELRLSRLNFWSKIFLRRMNYFKTRGQTDAYLASFFAPFVYIWATINVVLAAMQLEFSVQQVYGAGDGASWLAFAAVGRWASIAILVVAAFSVLLILLLVCVRYMEQLIFALKDLSRKRRKVERDHEK